MDKIIKEYTCIICPNSCKITVTISQDKQIEKIEGALCKRGNEYVTQEVTNPMRTIASSVKVQNGDLPLASVRLTNPIPRSEIMNAMSEIEEIEISAPVHVGQVLIHDILGYDSDLIVTKNVSIGH